MSCYKVTIFMHTTFVTFYISPFVLGPSTAIVD